MQHRDAKHVTPEAARDIQLEVSVASAAASATLCLIHVIEAWKRQAEIEVNALHEANAAQGDALAEKYLNEIE